MNIAPTFAHCVWLAAPCRPPLAAGFASVACPNLLKQVRSRRLQPRGGRCACGLAKPDPRPRLARPDHHRHRHLQVQAAEPALPGRSRAASSGRSALHVAKGEVKSVGAP
jgi:hypothetical protein